ncbi:hypothetical protein TNCV_3560571 [Trichonephila clavipes]|uniref:Uncharacterized protein n=1 Tax=Trichonephila clavipes TaxID=2585209 RepID=A0A8X6WDS6_TRICX|nr:hypothetical protein TNCV_3560571 [Trichonephila clavipes]
MFTKDSKIPRKRKYLWVSKVLRYPYKSEKGNPLKGSHSLKLSKTGVDIKSIEIDLWTAKSFWEDCLLLIVKTRILNENIYGTKTPARLENWLITIDETNLPM